MAVTDSIRNPSSDREVLRLLEANDLTLPEGADECIGLYDDESDNQLIGCGFLKGNMFQGVAIDSSYQGTGLSATLITALMQAAIDRRLTSFQVITKTSMARFFQGLGFRQVADASPYAIFLEAGTGSVASRMKELEALAKDKPTPRSCIVMNANPFTLGHRALIERAASESPWLWVLAVQEDISEFPFNDRIALIREGTSDLKNVSVIPGGEYVISSKTFPAYFLRRADLASAQGAMDAAVFAEQIAPALGVTRRFVGTEPFSPSTALYNAALLERLPPKGIEVTVIDRVASTGENSDTISASRVRECLRSGTPEDWSIIKSMVPPCTWDYLNSEKAKPVIAKLRA